MAARMVDPERARRGRERRPAGLVFRLDVAVVEAVELGPLERRERGPLPIEAVLEGGDLVAPPGEGERDHQSGASPDVGRVQRGRPAEVLGSGAEIERPARLVGRQHLPVGVVCRRNTGALPGHEGGVHRYGEPRHDPLTQELHHPGLLHPRTGDRRERQHRAPAGRVHQLNLEVQTVLPQVVAAPRAPGPRPCDGRAAAPVSAPAVARRRPRAWQRGCRTRRAAGRWPPRRGRCSRRRCRRPDRAPGRRSDSRSPRRRRPWDPARQAGETTGGSAACPPSPPG